MALIEANMALIDPNMALLVGTLATLAPPSLPPRTPDCQVYTRYICLNGTGYLKLGSGPNMKPGSQHETGVPETEAMRRPETEARRGPTEA